MPHGHMREFDDKDRERGWESDERDWAERNRSFMFGERDLGRREPEQGFADRDRGMRQYGRAHDHGGFTGDRERISRHFSSRQDDHYLSWRDKQIDALDRDYADYCREREQQFHEEFDAWRRRRRTNPEPLQTGMMQTGQSSDISGTLELSSAQEVQPQPQPDPVDTATLGTTSTGRRM